MYWLTVLLSSASFDKSHVFFYIVSYIFIHHVMNILLSDFQFIFPKDHSRPVFLYYQVTDLQELYLHHFYGVILCSRTW